MDKLNSYPITNSGVIGRILDSPDADHIEAVIVLPSSGKVEVLNDVGARIWSLADGTRTVNEVAATICDEYAIDQATAEKDTLEFLEMLLDRGVIRLSENPVG